MLGVIALGRYEGTPVAVVWVPPVVGRVVEGWITIEVGSHEFVPVMTPVAGTLVKVFFGVVVVTGASWLLDALGTGRITMGVEAGAELELGVGMGVGVGVDGGVVIGLVEF